MQTFDFDVDQFGVHTQRHIARQRPWSGRPGDHAYFRFLEQGKANNHGRILNLFVALSCFEV